MRRYGAAGILALWLAWLVCCFSPARADGQRVTLQVIPRSATEFTNVLQHYVYFDAETGNAEKLTLRVRNPSGENIAFRTQRHAADGFEPSRSVTYTLRSDQTVFSDLNVLFPNDLTPGVWTVEVTASALHRQSAVREIQIIIREPAPLKMDLLPQVHDLLIGTGSRKTVPVQAGKIRYIAQNPKDAWFAPGYWQSIFYDLREGANRKCTRAIFSMALSYLGIDCTPVRMSELVTSEEIYYTYDPVCEKLGNVVRVSGDLETLWADYQSGKGSPVLLHFTYPGGMHGILLAARDPDNPELFYAVTTGQRVNTSAFPDGTRRDAVIPVLIEKGETGQQIQCPLLKRYHKGRIDQIWQWKLTEQPAD